MLLKRTILDGIADGRISLVFRRWRRPTVKKGGTLNTAIGVLAIDDIALIDARAIADQDSIQAGYATLTALKAELSKRTELPHRRPSGRRRSLGLTESLDRGYRLSPRGMAVRAHLNGQAPARADRP